MPSRRMEMMDVAEEPARIVVGVDGSEESRHALRWAAHKSRRLGASLHVVLAFLEPYVVPHGPSIPRDRGRVDEKASAVRDAEHSGHRG